MNPAYIEIIAAKENDRRDLFATAATEAGTTVQNIEKDFWVCWTLDVLFHHLSEGSPRLLFKGGTSLSKAYGFISRFSEDIDVTVFRSDLGERASVDDLEALSKKKRRKKLEAIKSACQQFIGDDLRAMLVKTAAQTMEAAGKDPNSLQVEIDLEDGERQSLLVRYPTVVGAPEYLKPWVKIESGAKSALDPNEPKRIKPYVASVARNGRALAIDGVTTIVPERTFLDKILILHGMTFYFDANGTLRGDGRMSRHYYDAHRLLESDIGKTACVNDTLIEDCIRHARMFFHRSNTGLECAERGRFRLQPTKAMLDPLRRDYEAMSTMIFGGIPTFEAVLQSVENAEAMLNSTSPGETTR